MALNYTTEKDKYGVYIITFVYTEPDDGKTYVFKTYQPNEKVKSLGGRFCTFCEDDGRIKFYRSEYLRDRGYSKFVKSN